MILGSFLKDKLRLGMIVDYVKKLHYCEWCAILFFNFSLFS